MRHTFPSLIITMASCSPSTRKPTSNPNLNPNPNSNCRHSPSATLDILILILVLFSGAFLISSYCSYIFHSLSLILPPISVFDTPYSVIGFIFLGVLVVILVGFEICCGFKSNKCGKVGCKGLKKAREFDLQLQSEECLRSKSRGMSELDELPWKGVTERNPDYECLRAELRKMAPPNGRAVLLFRAKCGCPVAKLQGWGPKRGRRNKKSLALNGRGGDRR